MCKWVTLRLLVIRVVESLGLKPGPPRALCPGLNAGKKCGSSVLEQEWNVKEIKLSLCSLKPITDKEKEFRRNQEFRRTPR